jgi:hypothetical protein
MAAIQQPKKVAPPTERQIGLTLDSSLWTRVKLSAFNRGITIKQWVLEALNGKLKAEGK